MAKRTLQYEVKCHKCGKTFPVGAIVGDDEAERSLAAAKKGRKTVRVERWCPWCQQTNVVNLPIELARLQKAVVFREVKGALNGMPQKQA